MRLFSSLLKAAYLWKRAGGRPKPYLYIACMPKTASTFLAQVMHELTGYTRERAVFVCKRNEQQLYLPSLLDSYSRGTINQHHTRATWANLELMRLFRIRPVILVRHLCDIAVSYRDHLLVDSTKVPVCYADDRFRQLSEASQYSFIVTFCLPWCFSFYVSWDEATRNGQIDALWVTYEDLVADGPGTVARIADFWGLRANEARARSAIERARASKIRFNKGVLGRGRIALTDEQMATIRSMAALYPGTDFSRVGL